jgi:hypothetical protein
MNDDEDSLRVEISALLTAGLETETEPFPATEKEFGAILDDLRRLSPGDVEGKLVRAGFLYHPFGRDMMRCKECNYYLTRRKWCDLPEVSLPVEPDWWCRLWRI